MAAPLGFRRALSLDVLQSLYQPCARKQDISPEQGKILLIGQQGNLAPRETSQDTKLRIHPRELLRNMSRFICALVRDLPNAVLKALVLTYLRSPSLSRNKREVVALKPKLLIIVT